MASSSQQLAQQGLNEKKQSRVSRTAALSGGEMAPSGRVIVSPAANSKSNKRKSKSRAGGAGSSTGTGSDSVRSNRSSGVDHVFQDDASSDDFDPFQINSNHHAAASSSASYPSVEEVSAEFGAAFPGLAVSSGLADSSGSSRRQSRSTFRSINRENSGTGNSSLSSSSSNPPDQSASDSPNKTQSSDPSNFFQSHASRTDMFAPSAGSVRQTNASSDTDTTGERLLFEKSADNEPTRNTKQAQKTRSKPESKVGTLSLMDKLFDKGFEERERERKMRAIQRASKRQLLKAKHNSQKNLQKSKPPSISAVIEGHKGATNTRDFDEFTEFSNAVFPTNASAAKSSTSSKSSKSKDGSKMESISEPFSSHHGPVEEQDDAWDSENDDSSSGSSDSSDEAEKDDPQHVKMTSAQYARVATRQFDVYFSLHNPEKEKALPIFSPSEIVLATAPTISTISENAAVTTPQPIRRLGHYWEYKLQSIQMDGSFGDSPASSPLEQARQRFTDRSVDGSYCVKYVSPHLLATPELGPHAAADLVLEIRILCNLPGHPNIASIYAMVQGGVSRLAQVSPDFWGGESSNGADSLSFRNEFFFLTDRIDQLLPDRIEKWRHKQGYNEMAGSKLNQRLEVALDISSALLFLHDRNIVFHVRPDKVGFDARQNLVKLFNFSEARQDGMKASDQSRFITKSTSIHTLAYTAPEVLCNAEVTTSSDVYGFAILLWQLVSLKEPFEGMDKEQHFDRVVKEHERPIISGKWPHDVGKLLEGCWDPFMRMTMKKANEDLETILLF